MMLLHVELQLSTHTYTMHTCTDQTRQDQTRPDQTRPHLPGIPVHAVHVYIHHEGVGSVALLLGVKRACAQSLLLIRDA